MIPSLFFRGSNVVLKYLACLTVYVCCLFTALHALTTPETGDVAVGEGFAFGLKSDGTLWSWGSNEVGQLGDGSNEAGLTPRAVSGLSGVCAVSAGMDSAVALLTDGSVWVWGGNSIGQLGDGTTVNKNTPFQLSELPDVIAVSSGMYHSLALTDEGDVYSWGNNQYKQLGYANAGDTGTPSKINGLSSIVAVSAGGYHNLALSSDGKVYSWGSNGYGQLGDGTLTTNEAPTVVTGLNDIVGVFAGTKFSLAIGSDGTIWGWGANESGSLGAGTDGESSYVPVQVGSIDNLSALASGEAHAMALDASGYIWSWGLNDLGQLGDGSTENSSTPIISDVFTGVEHVATSQKSSMVALNDGTVWSWGADPWNHNTNVSFAFNQAAISLIDSSEDSNENGVLDEWEVTHLGGLSTAIAETDTDDDGLNDMQEYLLRSDPGEVDTDGDGVSDLEEYQAGTDLTDYYNGELPVLTSLVDSSGIPGEDGVISVLVTTIDGAPLANAPIAFRATKGVCLIANQARGQGEGAMIVSTDSNGVASAYVTFLEDSEEVFEVSAESGSNSVVLLIYLIPSPSSYPGMCLWLKADEGVNAGADGAISSWLDQSENEHEVYQSNSGKRPVLVSDALDGRPVVRFDGINDTLVGDTTDILRPEEISVVAVYKLSELGSYPKIITQPFNTQWATPYVTWMLGAGHLDGDLPYSRLEAETSKYAISRQGVLDEYVVLASTYDGAESRIYLNGFLIESQALTGALSYGSSQHFYLGACPTGGYLNGDIAEVMVYDRALGSNEFLLLNSYLEEKYGLGDGLLTDLPEALVADGVSSSQISLTWNYEFDQSPTVFYIERKTEAGEFEELAQLENSLSYVDCELESSTEYTYRIKARTYKGVSGYSDEVQAVTLAGEIPMPLDKALVWLKADSGLSTDPDGTVDCWMDQSGNRNDVGQSSASRQPMKVSESLNDRPVVRFDGINDILVGETTDTMRPDTISIVAVYKLSNVGNYPKIITQTYNANWASPYVTWLLGAGFYGTGNPYSRMEGLVSRYTQCGEEVLDEYVLLTSTYDGVESRIYLNGVLVDSEPLTGALEYGTSSHFYLGGSPGGGHLNGDIAEVFVFNDALDSAERDSVDRYLNNKYKILHSTNQDTDGDGISDEDEEALGLDPNYSDNPDVGLILF